jgi:DNA-binding LytR/AlgR family response regulator
MNSTRARLQAEAFQQEAKNKQAATTKAQQDAAKAEVDARMKKFWGGDLDMIKAHGKTVNAIDRLHRWGKRRTDGVSRAT